MTSSDLIHGAVQVVRKLNSGAPEDLAHVLGEGKRVGIVGRDPTDLRIDGEGDFDEFVERWRVVRGAEGTHVFGTVERLERGPGFENAAAAGTEHVPGHVEEADPGGVHQRADHQLFAELMLRGEGERIDAAVKHEIA